MAAGLAGEAAISRGRSRHGTAVGDRSGSGAARAGGTYRRPKTMGCNLHDDLQLPDALRRGRVALVDQDESSMRANPGGTPRAEGVFPPVFPLDTLILAATMVVVGSVTGAGSMEGAWAVVEVHPEPIDGPRIEGFVLDRHVISSRPPPWASWCRS